MNPNAPLDPESRRQMDIIELRTAIEELKKKNTAELELRIKTLEEARQRQIAFNTEVSNRLAKLEKPVEKPIVKPEVKEIKFKWPWQK